MKTIVVAVFLTFSAQAAFASDFDLPALKYDQRPPSSLPRAPEQGTKEFQFPSFDQSPNLQKQTRNTGIARDGVVRPSEGIDYKIRVVKAPRLDQGIIKNADAKR